MYEKTPSGYVVRCHRCGMPVKYKTKSGAYRASLKHKDKPFLCKDCLREYGDAVAAGRELPDSNMVYESKTCALVRCPKCGETKKLVGSTMVRGFAKLHGRCGENYLCRKCSAKAKVPEYKVCSVCGGKEKFKNHEAARKFVERHPEWNPYVCQSCRKKLADERNTLVCSVCGEAVPAKTRYQKRLRRWCGEGKSIYVCEKCKAPNADYVVSGRRTKRIPLIKTPEYLAFSDSCSTLYKEFVSSGFSDSGLTRLLNGLGDLCEKNRIYSYDLNVVNGVVEGVLFHGVSVYGEVYVRF